MSIAGARPNFMKLASIAKAAETYNLEIINRGQDKHEKIEHIIVHTGQHYDEKMSKSFFDELGIPGGGRSRSISWLPLDRHVRRLCWPG